MGNSFKLSMNNLNSNNFVSHGKMQLGSNLYRRSTVVLRSHKYDEYESTLKNNSKGSNSVKFAVVTTMAIVFMNANPNLVFATDSSTIGLIAIVRPVLDIFINTLNLLFLFRTIISWYPKTDLNKLPYKIAVWPTEPLLEPVRSLIPPTFGVDISSIVWIFLLSFFREIMTGQQGILTLLEKS
eukprot:gene9635-12973_t